VQITLGWDDEHMVGPEVPVFSVMSLTGMSVYEAGISWSRVATVRR